MGFYEASKLLFTLRKYVRYFINVIFSLLIIAQSIANVILAINSQFDDRNVDFSLTSITWMYEYL